MFGKYLDVSPKEQVWNKKRRRVGYHSTKIKSFCFKKCLARALVLSTALHVGTHIAIIF
jgi:hypothetical protein